MTLRALAIPSIVSLAVVLVADVRPAHGAPKVLVEGPLVSMEGAIQEFDPANFQLFLALVGPLRDVHGQPTDIAVDLVRAGGKWAAARAQSGLWLQLRVAVDTSELLWTPKGLAGTLRITADRDRPQASTEHSFRLQAGLLPADQTARLPAAQAAAARAEPAVRLLAGTYALGDDGAQGVVAGHFTLPRKSGFFDRGRYDGGLVLDLDMGTERVNWNHQRSATYLFPQPRDLRGFTALRVRVRTDKPREDAAVTFWLGEADGSWYYLKDAVPLTAAESQAVLRFEDFALAEWVAPGNHVDEDYALDLKSIGAFAVGVVNPLGVGRVAFTVTAIDLIREDLPPLAPIAAQVTGKTLSVNGHNLVPVGVFGGYAQDLPAEYRPGCQRALYATTQPILPRKGASELFWINCYGERTQTADFFRADWRQHLESYGRTFADNARRGGAPVVFEFWNEPYLNWAERSWVHYQPELYKVWKAAEGGRVAVARGSEVCWYHVLDWKRLAAIFRQGKAADAASLERHLRDGLDKRAAEALDGPADGQEPPRDTQAALLRALNGRLIPREGDGGAAGELYQEPRFAGVSLPAYAAELLARHKQGRLAGRELAMLNRALVAAKYPGLLAEDPAAAPDEIIPHFKWKRIPTGWRVVDETAFTFWSGKGNGFIYDSMLGVVGPAIKQTHPAVKVFGGWGFRWNEDHWDAWRILYQPTIDNNVGWIDGVNEHHYQGDPAAMQGTYEVLAAYGMTKHGKWLYSINTETNDLLDSPVRGHLDTPDKCRLSTEYRRMVYNMRDCLYSVLQTPDKAYARTVIHWQRMPEATRVAYGMMKDLRGRLIETESSDPDLWVVASVDGTDPNSMPPPGEPQRALVVFVFNDRREEREVRLTLQAPEGTGFAGGTVQRNTVDWQTYAIDLAAEPVKAAGTQAEFAFRLPGRMAWKVSLPLAAPIPKADQVRRRQFFSPDILQPIRRDKPLATTILLDPKALAAAKRAFLRLVVEDVARGEGLVAVNGRGLALPAAFTPDNCTRILSLPLDVAGLTAQTKVEFTVAGGNHAGYQVDMTSIVLEER